MLFWFALALSLLVVVILVVLLYYSLCKLIYKMAVNEILFFLPIEGEIVFVMNGDQLYRVVPKVKGFKLDEEDNLVPITPGEKPKITFMEKLFGGVRWLGFPPRKLFHYHYVWDKAPRKDNEDNIIMDHKDEDVRSLFWRYPYGLKVAEAETSGQQERLRVDSWFVVEVEIRNPRKTIFGTAGSQAAGNWIQAVLGAVESAIRDWIGCHSYQDLIQTQNETANRDGFVATIKKVNKTGVGNTSIIENYGVEVIAINFVNIELLDDAVIAAANKVYLEQQNLDAAKLEKERRVELAKATRAEAAAPLNAERDFMRSLLKMSGGEKVAVSRNLKNVTTLAGESVNLLLPIGGATVPTASVSGTATREPASRRRGRASAPPTPPTPPSPPVTPPPAGPTP